MSSQNKKNKAKNSYIYNGGEKNSLEDWKCRRIAYYTKRDRNKNKDKVRKEINEDEKSVV
jgi:hypothetical protein